MGFNTFKLCLYVPDETLFDIADEMGMLLWLELPLWQPTMTPALRELTMREYSAILCRLHHHPSIVIVSLGCELDQQTGADLLSELGSALRFWMPNVLRCDNSGSSEAYGGDLGSGGDFYDYHFYCEPHYFQDLIDHFQRAYQLPKPWIFGEFSDADTLRDFSQLASATWWINGPFTFERDELTWLSGFAGRLADAGVHDGGAALTGIARQQAQAVRKFILERVRLNFVGGGYVVTGWKDTPIATSGILDDQDQLKFDSKAWRMFNNDVVLLLDRPRCRHWVNGGDRPRYLDGYVFWADEVVDLRLILVNGGPPVERAQLTCSILNRSAHLDLLLDFVTLVEDVSVLALSVSLVEGANQIRASLLAIDKCLCETRWDLLSISPAARTHALAQVAALPSQIDAALLSDVSAGASAIVWLPAVHSSFTHPMPFWRESIHVFQPHPFWEHVPQDGFADMRFFSVATDFAIDLVKLHGWIEHNCLCENNAIELTPIWRRFDARAMVWHDYLVEVRVGRGRLFISTLRFAGGLGQQPHGLEDNPMGCLLLSRLLDLVEMDAAAANIDPV